MRTPDRVCVDCAQPIADDATAYYHEVWSPPDVRSLGEEKWTLDGPRCVACQRVALLSDFDARLKRLEETVFIGEALR